MKLQNSTIFTEHMRNDCLAYDGIHAPYGCKKQIGAPTCLLKENVTSDLYQYQQNCYGYLALPIKSKKQAGVLAQNMLY